MMKRVFRAFLFFLPALLLAVGPVRADEVAVRGWDHGTHGRLVFDWPARVDYAAEVRGSTLSIRFERRIDARFAAALQNLRDYATGAAVGADGRTVEVALTRPYRLQTFRSGNAVVVDLRGGATAADAPPLGIRLGEHPTYSRMVFDWPGPVDYAVDRGDGRVQVRFNRPARVNVDALNAAAVPGIGEISVANGQDSLTLSATVATEARLRHFRNGTRVVLDVFRDAAEGGGAKGEDVRPPAGAATAPDVAVPPETASPNEAPVPPPALPTDSASVPRSLLPLPSSGSPSAAMTGPTAAASGGAASRVVAPTQAASPQAASPQAASPQAASPQAASPQAASPQAVSPLEPAFAPGGEAAESRSAGPLVTLFFEWPEPVGAAVFNRAGYTWIVFDRRSPIDLAPLRDAGKGVIERLEQLPIGNASVLRMTPAQGVVPRAYREGANWAVEFRRGRMRPDVPIAVQAEADAGEGEGGRVLFPVVEPGRQLRIPDPEVGDLIHIGTVQASGHGVEGVRVFPEFTVLASVQGVAVVPLSEEIELAGSEAGLVVTAPGGLYLSGVRADAGAPAPRPRGNGRRIFRLAEWQRGDAGPVSQVRQDLQLAAAMAGANERDAARLDLARFFFAHGSAAEAMGILRTLQFADPRLESQAEFKALRGAVSLLLNDLEQAAADLADPRLDPFEEVHLWRAVLAAEQEDWREAERIFELTEPILESYPDPLMARLSLARADSALHARDPAAAGRVLAKLETKAENLTRGQNAKRDYLSGRVAFLRRNLDEAERLWTQLAEGRDARYAARAELSLVNMGLLQETMTVPEAIDRLEKLRFVWRGDDFEFQVLRRLGDLYFDRDDYRNGLATFRVAATYFPQHAEAPQIADKLTAVFKELYLEGKADRLPPLTALAVYDEFRELTPPGAEGNRMIEMLAGRLVDVDLLNRAAELLDHQVRFRLKGPERARVGAKLALVQLLDGNPEAALSSLQTTEFPQLDRPLEDDRRRIRARALFELGQADEAVDLLVGDVSRSADLLRADIYWKTEEWPAVAKIFQRLAGPPPLAGQAYDQSQARTVLNWAVSLQLSDDRNGLTMLRDLYGPAMAQSPLSNAFAFIASAPRGNEPLDLERIASRISDIDRFEAFLADYRERLLKTPKQSEAETAAAGVSG